MVRKRSKEHREMDREGERGRRVRGVMRRRVWIKDDTGTRVPFMKTLRRSVTN